MHGSMLELELPHWRLFQCRMEFFKALSLATIIDILVMSKIKCCLTYCPIGPTAISKILNLSKIAQHAD
jgi:hypothetical protein